MVFGRIAAKRARKHEKSSRRQLSELKAEKSFDPLAQAEKERAGANQLANQATERQKNARGAGRQYATEFLNQDIQGLNPKQKVALQEGAFQNISSNAAREQRQLAATQGRRGVNGGAAFAQQQELNRDVQQQRNQVNRDLINLENENVMKKLAAMFGVEQGFVGQDIYNYGQAQNEMRDLEERRRLQANTKQFKNKSFNRI
jgi:hypothetical protein